MVVYVRVAVPGIRVAKAGTSTSVSCDSVKQARNGLTSPLVSGTLLD